MVEIHSCVQVGERGREVVNWLIETIRKIDFGECRREMVKRSIIVETINVKRGEGWREMIQVECSLPQVGN